MYRILKLTESKDKNRPLYCTQEKGAEVPKRFILSSLLLSKSICNICKKESRNLKALARLVSYMGITKQRTLTNAFFLFTIKKD